QVPPAGDVICGYPVPGGTQIAHNFSGVMRLKNIFGEDADVFRPERWLEAGEEDRKRMEGVVGLCFGWGKYSCLGRRVAEVEDGSVKECGNCPVHGGEERKLRFSAGTLMDPGAFRA